MVKIFAQDQRSEHMLYVQVHSHIRRGAHPLLTKFTASSEGAIGRGRSRTSWKDVWGERSDLSVPGEVGHVDATEVSTSFMRAPTPVALPILHAVSVAASVVAAHMDTVPVASSAASRPCICVSAGPDVIPAAANTTRAVGAASPVSATRLLLFTLLFLLWG